MGIIWCGGEDLDFEGGPIYTMTDSWARRSGYARCAICYSSGALPSSKSFAGGAVTDCWFAFRVYLYLGMGGVPKDKPLLGVGKYGTSSGIFVGTGHVSNYNVALMKMDAGSVTILDEVAGWSHGVVHKVDVKITSFGATGNIKVYLNGSATSAIDYTGDLTTGDMSDLDCVRLYGIHDSYDGVMSEMIVADEDTRTFGLITLAPNAAGDTNDWTGAYTDIDETTMSDADMVYSNADAEDFQCNMTDTPAGDYAIKGIRISARALATADATVSGLKLGVKSGGTIDVDSGRDLTTLWDNVSRWTETVNGAQLNRTLLDAIQLDLQTTAVTSSSPSSSVSSSPSASSSASTSASASAS